jgi:hypothetical protein
MCRRPVVSSNRGFKRGGSEGGRGRRDVHQGRLRGLDVRRRRCWRTCRLLRWSSFRCCWFDLDFFGLLLLLLFEEMCEGSLETFIT